MPESGEEGSHASTCERMIDSGTEIWLCIFSFMQKQLYLFPLCNPTFILPQLPLTLVGGKYSEHPVPMFKQ